MIYSKFIVLNDLVYFTALLTHLAAVVSPNQLKSMNSAPVRILFKLNLQSEVS